MTIPLIAFDLDGTLADTESIAIPGAIAVLSEQYGLDIPLEHWMAHYHGMAGQPLLKKIHEDYGVEIDWQDFLANRRKRLPIDFAGGVKSAPGVLETLAALAERGQTMAICSNSMADRIAMTLEKMQGQPEAHVHLPTLFGGKAFAAVDNPDLNPKPAPDVYLAAAKASGVDPTLCVAVEDSATGATSALAAGFTTIGYVGLASHPELEATKLAAAGVKRIMRHWDEFIPMLDALGDSRRASV
jgi:beta-phosphoglucomutase-like phosphatase (HAD superfamily)